MGQLSKKRGEGAGTTRPAIKPSSSTLSNLIEPRHDAFLAYIQ